MNTTYYFTVCSYVTNIGNGTSYNVNAKTKSILTIYNNGSAPYGMTEMGMGRGSVGTSSISISEGQTDIGGYESCIKMGNPQFYMNTNVSGITSLDDYSKIVFNINTNGYTTSENNLKLVFRWYYSGKEYYVNLPVTTSSATTSTQNAYGTISSSAKSTFKSYCSSYGALKTMYICAYYYMSDWNQETSTCKARVHATTIYKITLE